MRPGLFIPVWHNSGHHRLTPSGQVWQKIGFGMWRKLRTIDADEAVGKGFSNCGHSAIVKLFYRSYGWQYHATDGFLCGLKLQLGGLWVGAHYSQHNRRWCINLIPCVTVWVALKGGKRP